MSLERLGARITAYVGKAERRETEIPGLTLVHRRVVAAPACMTYEPSIAVITRGRKEVTLGKTPFVYGAGEYLLTAVDLPIVSRLVEVPFVGMALRLDMTLVREMVNAVEGREAAGTAMGVGRATPEMLDACLRMVGLLDAAGDVPVMSGLIQREIIYRILRGPEGGRLRAIATMGDQRQRTARAIAWLRAHFDEPLRVEALAQVAGMGVSTLHHHFRAMTAMSPLQYQKQLRLQTARGRMLMEGLDAASAACWGGDGSASQFSREYARFFGAPPRRDVRG